MIGQPFRRLLYEGHTGKLHISFGKTFKFPITISQSLNNKAESYLLPDPMEEVKAASLELLDEPDLEDEIPFFIEEEAEPSEPLDEFAETPRPPIELKTLPLLGILNIITKSRLSSKSSNGAKNAKPIPHTT